MDLLLGKQEEVQTTLQKLKQSIHHIQQHRDLVSAMLADLDQMKLSQQKAVLNIEKHLLQMTAVANNMIKMNSALEQ